MDQKILLEIKSYIEYYDGLIRLSKKQPKLGKSLKIYDVPSKQRSLPEDKLLQQGVSFSKAVMMEEVTLEEYIRNSKNEDTFSTKLLKFIDATGLPDSEIYKRAGIDRRHFSKIRCDKEYRPKKATAVALCFALKLPKGQAEELLKLAGYSLSNSATSDLVVRFCLENEIYDLLEVNQALDYFGQKIL